jgi:hypothetical protein
MDFSILKGKRFWLFVILGLIGGIQAIQPFADEHAAGVITATLSILGVLKTFIPYEPKSGEIETGLGKN